MKELLNTKVYTKEVEKDEKILVYLILDINGFKVNIKPAFELTKSQYRAFMLSIEKNQSKDIIDEKQN